MVVLDEDGDGEAVRETVCDGESESVAVSEGVIEGDGVPDGDSEGVDESLVRIQILVTTVLMISLRVTYEAFYSLNKK